MAYFGEIAALTTAVSWTISSLAFESAGKKIGSLSVNLIRLVLAFCFFALLNYYRRGLFLPLDASPDCWLWLTLSGVVGFLFGDLLLFKAFTVIGARISMLINALSPPITAIVSWFTLGEVLSPMNWLGIAVTLTGISIVILKHEKKETDTNNWGKLTTSYNLKGILLALGGAIGQGICLVLSKRGMGTYDAFAASHIRVIAGMIGFAVMVLLLKRGNSVNKALSHIPAMKRIALGAVFGPFLGVGLSLIALQHTEAGIAATSCQSCRY
jgi:drug/metabolite transporter (DMT)-like permease